MSTATFKQKLKSPGFRQVRKIVVTIVGVVVILAGIVLLFFPGPAFIVIPAGFAILAIEYKWARSWVNKARSPGYLKKLVYENSLSLALFGAFVVCLGGQVIAGQITYNQEREDYAQPPVTLRQYVFTGHCVEAIFENWESEFLQMGALVILTIFLRQRGAMDSKKIRSGVHHSDTPSRNSRAPWPARQKGWVRKLYANSLSIALFLLFAFSFLLHAAGGVREHNEERARMGKPPLTMASYVGSSQFWFESFQNWQSEFLSVGVLLVLSIFLRQEGSPQSKPLSAPYGETG